MIPFDAEFASARRRRVHRATCSSARSARRSVAIGENFRFGHKAQGDPRLLQADERFATTVHPLLEVDGEIVSSSHIRGLVLAGERGRGQPPARRAFQLCGEVVHGDERGRELGFPTANLVPEEALACPGPRRLRLPAPTASAGGRHHRRAPDLPDGPRRADRGLPARLRRRPLRQSLCLEFLERLRGERRFDSAEALVEQMHRDVERTRELVAGASAERLRGSSGRAPCGASATVPGR